MTPITRREMFMAKAVGEDVPTLEPITREEFFLSQISGGGGGGGSMEVDANTYTVGTLSWDGDTEGRDTATLSLMGGMLSFTGYKVANDTDIKPIVGSMVATIGGNAVNPVTTLFASENFDALGYITNDYSLYAVMVVGATSASGSSGLISYSVTAQSAGVYFIGADSFKWYKPVAVEASIGSTADEPVYDGVTTVDDTTYADPIAVLAEFKLVDGATYKVAWGGETYEAVAQWAVLKINNAIISVDERLVLGDTGVTVYTGTQCFLHGADFSESQPIQIWEVETAKIPLDLVETPEPSIVTLYVKYGELATSASAINGSNVYKDGGYKDKIETVAELADYIEGKTVLVNASFDGTSCTATPIYKYQSITRDYDYSRTGNIVFFVQGHAVYSNNSWSITSGFAGVYEQA